MTWCPLDHAAHIVGSATPKFAKMVSWKYSKMGAPAVQEDMVTNHGRKLAVSYIKHLSDDVGLLVEDHMHEPYDIPELDEPVATVGIGLDGTCMLLFDRWMTSGHVTVTICIYDHNRITGNTQLQIPALCSQFRNTE